MYEALSIAATGLYNQQRKIDTISDNVANVNTVGFKSARVDFKDALYTSYLGPTSSPPPEGNQQKGHGLMVASMTKEFGTSSIQVTENQLDFAIEGDAFFEIMGPNGEIRYTRGGNFYTQPNTVTGEQYLVDAKGYFVLNSGGERITVPEGTVKVEADGAGNLTFLSGLSEEPLGTDSFGLYTFENKMGLSATGGSLYEVTVASGEKISAGDIKLRQGALELSNVNLGDEMTRLIRASRAFSLASRALKTADDMEGIANNLRS